MAIIPPVISDSLVYGSIFALMSLGLTLSYMTSKVPNFAHGSFITLGAYVSYSMFRFLGVIPYMTAPLSFLMGGATGVGMYLFVLRPLIRRGATVITLMIGTFAVVIAFTGIFGAYADYLSNVFKFPDSRFFLLASHDLLIFKMKGINVVGPLLLVFLTLSLYIFLTKTKFGVAMRATVQNPSMAEILGVNVQRVYIVSWFLAGGLAALAGNLFILRLPGDPNIGTDFTIAFFAASLLGGLSSIYGAILGGLIVGAGEILVTYYVSQVVGVWFIAYQPAIPMAIMVIGLLLVPEGIVSVEWRKLSLKGVRTRLGGRQ